MNNTKQCLLWVLLILVSTSCIEEESLELCFFESSPYVTETIVERSNNHLAFPTIAGRPNGSKLLVAYREGHDHISFDGKIIQKESYDQGRTWINRKVIFEGESGCDARDPQFVVLSDETIICRFFVRTSQTSSTIKYIYSEDWGKTYSDWVGEFPMPFKSETFAAARGNMLVVNDTIFSTAYNRWNESWLLRSNNRGLSWEFVSWVDHTPPGSTNTVHRQLNESSLGIQGDKMYVVARSGTDEVRKLQVACSEDWGHSWKDWKELPVYGQAPSLTPYKDKHILSYRNTNIKENAGKQYHFDITLFKDGNICLTPITVLRTSYFDIGYGDVITFDDFFILCCYTDKSIHCYKVEYNIFEESLN